ncbi:hypothetical protein N7465_000199 [Penicillium sp. CMV-2018d]|nr:hypothetical protein N7465_000199 [Penicillium sp. CMV-2018d]
MIAASLKALALSLLFAHAAYAEDHSSHNCCLLTGEGWTPMNDWTRQVCAERWGSVATFDGVKCIQKPGNIISGDDFTAACRLKGNLSGFRDWQKGAGYRGTC